MLKLQYFGYLVRRADSLEKPLMLEKIEGRRGSGGTEGETVRRHHRLSGRESEQVPGDSEGQRSLVCCSPRGLKELPKTQQLNNNRRTFKATDFG